MGPGMGSVTGRTQALIEHQIGRLTKLVDELLDVRESQTPGCTCNARVDLRVIVNDAIQTLESELNERNYRLVTEPPDAPLWL